MTTHVTNKARSKDTKSLKRWRVYIQRRHQLGKGANYTMKSESFEIEELAELHDIVERGPHWDAIIDISIMLQRHAEDPAMTVEKAERL